MVGTLLCPNCGTRLAVSHNPTSAASANTDDRSRGNGCIHCGSSEDSVTTVSRAEKALHQRGGSHKSFVRPGFIPVRQPPGSTSFVIAGVLGTGVILTAAASPVMSLIIGGIAIAAGVSGSREKQGFENEQTHRGEAIRIVRTDLEKLQKMLVCMDCGQLQSAQGETVYEYWMQRAQKHKGIARFDNGSLNCYALHQFAGYKGSVSKWVDDIVAGDDARKW